jgi:hypothetical protein
MTQEQQKADIPENLNTQFEYIHGRINDFQRFFGIFASLIAVFATGLSIFVNFNVNSETVSLQRFQDEADRQIREALGKAGSPAELVAKTPEGNLLANSRVKSSLTDRKDGNRYVSFVIVLQNTGKNETGPIFQKYYSNTIPLENRSTDQPNFKHEIFVERSAPSSLFGGVSLPYTISLLVPKNWNNISGTHQMLIRVYYSTGKIFESEFLLDFSPP